MIIDLVDISPLIKRSDFTFMNMNQNLWYLHMPNKIHILLHYQKASKIDKTQLEWNYILMN